MMDRDTKTRTGARAPGVRQQMPLARWGTSAPRGRTQSRVLRGREVHEGRMQTARREELADDGKALPDRPALKPYWGKPAVRKRVQEKLVCSVGDRPTKVIVQAVLFYSESYEIPVSSSSIGYSEVIRNTL